MKTKDLIKVHAIHDVCARDDINGRWHDGWRLDGSEIIAFCHGGQWFASIPGREFCAACADRAAALLGLSIAGLTVQPPLF